MKLKKFTAPTTREALQKLRAELGEDAIILSTKQTAAGTEVLAASSEDLDTVTEKPAASSAPVSWTKTERTQFAAQEATRQPTPAEKIAQQVAAQRDVLINRAPAVTHQIPGAMPAPDMISDVAKRRSQAASTAVLSFGPLELDTAGRRACARVGDVEHPIELGPREWTVLEYLLIHAPKPASKDKLLQALTGWDKEITPNAIEVYVSRLRAKLEPAGIGLRAIRGFGYRLECADAAGTAHTA